MMRDDSTCASRRLFGRGEDRFDAGLPCGPVASLHARRVRPRSRTRRALKPQPGGSLAPSCQVALNEPHHRGCCRSPTAGFPLLTRNHAPDESAPAENPTSPTETWSLGRAVALPAPGSFSWDLIDPDPEPIQQPSPGIIDEIPGNGPQDVELLVRYEITVLVISSWTSAASYTVPTFSSKLAPPGTPPETIL